MKRAGIGLLVLAATFFGFGVLPATAAPAEPAAQMTVKASTRNDVSPPLSTLAGSKGVKPSGAIVELQGGKRQLPVNNKGGGSTGGGGGVASPSSGPQTAGDVQANTPAATINVQGLGNSDNTAVHGFGVLPPDTNGDVGPNHYVQAVNLLIRIFDKTGTPLTGPTKMSSLFTGFGGFCESTDRGDPIVQYDPLANRWLLTQFAFGGSLTPAEQCVAVSTTPDPTGTYYRYSFPFGVLFNDYGKVGVWPDAYYLSVHLFNSTGSTYMGQGAAALDRMKMLTGQPATMILFNAGSGVGGMTPSDVVGFTPPAPGAKNFFFDPQDAAFEGGSDRVDMWGFHADFATPSNSTFTLDHSITTSAFDGNMCGFVRNCIPQGGTAQGVDAISYRGMNVVAYRNMGTHEAWAGNFTVDTGGDHAAPFWYEIRRSGGNPSLFQEGIHTPDAVHRWMGSISMDRAGDIALGYSGSSASIFPDIRYSTRVPGDAAGTLQTEVILQAGGGSQTHSAARWGDYSSMSVDPSDDCTFWYTTEYVTATGSAPWSSRIGAFKEPTCTPYTPTASNIGVAITGVPANSTVGTNFNYTVTVDNAGPNTAPGVSLSHNVGAGMQVVSATPSAGTCGTGAPVGCLLGDIASGGSVTINMTVKPTSAGVKNMSASVAQLATANDGTPANNSANASTTAAGGGGGVTSRYTTGNVAIPIPDLTTTDVIINVPDAGTILDVDMEVRLNHTFDADLDMYLIHPNGTTMVELSTDNGGASDNYGSGNNDCTGIPTDFDDEAATAITAGMPPFAGSFRPEGALTAFDGLSMTGNWTLRIIDDLAGDVGTLGCATIEIERQPIFRYTTGNVNIPLPDLSVTDVVINVPDPGTILDVNMEVRLNHTFDGDLEITLFHPDGTPTVLSNNRGGSGNDFGSGNNDCTGTHTIFDDEASTPIGSGTPPFNGPFRPDGPLSGLDGKPMMGNWTLRIHDQAGADVGTLFCATIEIQTSGAPAPQADLAVSQTATPNPASVNTPLQFDVTVDNLGPDGATNVVLTDTLPTNATFNSATPSQGTCGAPVSGVVTCNLGSIASGGQATVAINVTPTSTGTASNTASVTADETDPDTTNNSSTLDVPVYDADLQMTLTDAPDPVLAGTNLTYTMQIDNNGPGTAYNLQAVLTMPAGTTHVGNSGGCTVTPPTVTCSLASLAPGGTWIVTVTVFVPPTTPRFTVLNASATVSALTPDPVPGNNSDDESTLVDTAADLAIIGFAGPGTLPSTGGSYTITGRNFGPSTVPFASIQLNVPAGVTIASASGGSCTMGTGTVTCTTYGSVAPGGTYAMTVSIRAGRGARFTMTARTYSTVPDPNGLNNYASKNVQA